MLTCASSRQAIKKYINANNSITGMTEAAFNKHISRALEVGEGKVFEFPKGMYPHC
jgi:histone H1/5